MMSMRSLLQRITIGRASLLICISSVFRDHLVHDYRFPSGAYRGRPEPRPSGALRRSSTGRSGEPAAVLVLGRIAVRKGIEDVVALARILLERGATCASASSGGPSLWSDYTKLLEDLPPENAEYAGPVEASRVGAELEAADVLLAASRYEPFALTVAEALAAGVPVVGTSEVGAIGGVERAVAAEVPVGQPAAMAAAILAALERTRADPQAVRALARSEAERLFDPAVVCAEISRALERLCGSRRESPAVPR